MPENEYFRPDVGQTFAEWERQRRVESGMELPEVVRKAAALKAPKSAQTALTDMMAKGYQKAAEPAPKPRGGLFGWMERNVGRKLGFYISEVVPAFAELVVSPFAEHYIKWRFGDEVYKTYRANRTAEQLSFGAQIQKYGFGDALYKNIKQLSKARSERPGIFWAEKVIGELLSDPTTYMGWGIASKVPILGKLGLGFVMDTVPTQAWRLAGAGGKGLLKQGAKALPFLLPSREANILGEMARADMALRQLFGAKALASRDPNTVKDMARTLYSWYHPSGPIPDEWVDEFVEAFRPAMELTEAEVQAGAKTSGLPNYVQQFGDDAAAGARGATLSPAGTTPFGNPTGQRRYFEVKKNAKILDLTDQPLNATAWESANLQAFVALAGRDQVDAFLRLPRDQAARLLRRRFKGMKFRGLRDTLDVADAYGAALAREEGFEAVWRPATRYGDSEFLALTDDVLKKPVDPTFGMTADEWALTKESVETITEMNALLDDLTWTASHVDPGANAMSFLQAIEARSLTPEEFIKLYTDLIGHAKLGQIQKQYMIKMSNGWGLRTLLKWSDKIQVRPTSFLGKVINAPARAMLFFANYMPFNVVEDLGRTIGAGHSVHPLSDEIFSITTRARAMPGRLRVGGEASELGSLTAQMGGKMGEIPTLAKIPVFPIENVEQLLANAQKIGADFGSRIRRGVYFDDAMDFMRKANQKTYAQNEGYKRAMDSIHLIPAELKRDKQFKHIKAAVEFMLQSGEGDNIPQLLQAYTRGKIKMAELADIAGDKLHNAHPLVRYKFINELPKRGVDGLEALKDEVLEMAHNTFKVAHPERYDILFKERIALAQVLVDEAKHPREIMDMLSYMLMHIKEAESSLGVITESSIQIGRAQGMRTAGRVIRTGLEEFVDQQLKILDTHLSSLDTVLDMAKGKLATFELPAESVYDFGRVDKLWRKFVKGTRYELKRTTESLRSVSDEFFPEAKKGIAGWSAEIDEVVAASGVDGPDLRKTLNKLPKKMRELLLRSSAEIPDPTGVSVAKMPGYDILRNKLTKEQVKDAFWRAQQERVSEIYMVHESKVGAMKRLSADGRVTMQNSDLLEAQQELWNLMHPHSIPLPDDPLNTRMSAFAQKKIKQLEKDLKAKGGRVQRLLESFEQQRSTLWDNQQQAIIDAFDSAERIMRNAVPDDRKMALLQSYLNQTTDAARAWMSDPKIQSHLRMQATKASERATNTVHTVFPNYDDTMIFDAVMKSINPFWIYQSRAWPWMIGQSIRKPAFAANFGPEGRYWQLSDEGYIPQTLNGLQVSPIRGTVLGRLRRAFRGPTPLRFDGLARLPEQAIQTMERGGFYPGLHMTIPAEFFGTITSEGSTAKDFMSIVTEAAPSAPATLVHGFVAAANATGPNWISEFSNTLFPSKFKEYYTAKVLWEDHQVSLSQAQELGHDDWITDARAKASAYQMLEEQLSLTRINPNKWQEIDEKKAAVVTELTGISREEQEKYRMAGQRLSEVVPLSRMDRDKLRAIEGYDAIREASRTLSEGVKREYLETLADRYEMTEEFRKNLLHEQLLSDTMLQEGWMTPEAWRNDYYDRWREYRETLDNLVISEYYGKLGRSMDEQMAIKEKMGFAADLVHPVDVVLDTMFSMEPPADAFGNVDWFQLFEAQEQLLDLLPAEVKAEVQQYLNRNATPLMKKFREGREFMGDYWRVEKSLPAWYRKLGYEQEATEMEALFNYVRIVELDQWKMINQGFPVDYAKQQDNALASQRLQRHIAEFRWHMAWNENHPLYDPRINRYLLMFYGREGTLA